MMENCDSIIDLSPQFGETFGQAGVYILIRKWYFPCHFSTPVGPFFPQFFPFSIYLILLLPIFSFSSPFLPFSSSFILSLWHFLLFLFPFSYFSPKWHQLVFFCDQLFYLDKHCLRNIWMLVLTITIQNVFMFGTGYMYQAHGTGCMALGTWCWVCNVLLGKSYLINDIVCFALGTW
jgi:hypothetical protein